MKCGYAKCKHNGIVDKSEAIKVGTRYYHKDCHEEKQVKQEIEDYYISNMPQTTIVMLRKVINQLIETNGYDSEYILFTLKYIKKNGKPINVPFAIINYCNDKRILDEYKRIKVSLEYNKVKDSFNSIEDKCDFKFAYKPNDNWTKLI